jgi:hypothetical protein
MRDQAKAAHYRFAIGAWIPHFSSFQASVLRAPDENRVVSRPDIDLGAAGKWQAEGVLKPLRVFDRFVVRAHGHRC